MDIKIHATLAQLVEQQTENLRVWSSILRGGRTNEKPRCIALNLTHNFP